MKTIIELLTGFWYLWLLIALGIILQILGPKIKGYFGEQSVSFFLSRLDETKYKVINNIMIKVGDRTTQIDHIVVSNYGVFVIETKNYKGWITGNEYDDYWKQTIYKRKEKLRNPIKQNYGHIQALKEHLSEYPDINFISIVAFTTKADLKVNTKAHVIYTIKLPKVIRSYEVESISDSISDLIYSKLMSLNVDSKENRKEHVKAIHNDIDDKRNKVKNDICPKCGGNLVLRNGKHGQFKGCSNYPRCRFIAK